MNAIKAMLVASALVSLAGCASTAADFRKTTPVLDLKSSRPAHDVAVCIDDQWSDVLNGFVMRQTPEGESIVFVANGLIYYLADVNNVSGGGSETKYWVGTFTFSHYINKLGKAVKSCQD